MSYFSLCICPYNFIVVCLLQPHGLLFFRTLSFNCWNKNIAVNTNCNSFIWKQSTEQTTETKYIQCIINTSSILIHTRICQRKVQLKTMSIVIEWTFTCILDFKTHFTLQHFNNSCDHNETYTVYTFYFTTYVQTFVQKIKYLQSKKTLSIII